MSGPNDANQTPSGGANIGELNHQYETDRDDEFHTATDIPPDGNSGNPNGSSNDGDPTALEFQVNVNSTGWLNLDYVFATEELPGHEADEFNDSFAVVVQRLSGATTGDDLDIGKNIATLSLIHI